MTINQAVLFTKPIHHLNTALTPAELSTCLITFFKSHHFDIVLHQKRTGSQLAARQVIKEHYCLYSQAALAQPITCSPVGKSRFKEAFGTDWEHEEAAGRILPLPSLLQQKRINVHQLFTHWNRLFAAGQTAQLEDGMVAAWIEPLNCYGFNAFYPSMEANFYDPHTQIDYFVVEFDPDHISWKTFRKRILGSTNASNAHPESFRGQLYSDVPVDFPGRDNFIHGSAGPLEALLERIIHEPDFHLESNPIGARLAQRGLSIAQLTAWKQQLPIAELAAQFDQTEEKNSRDILTQLEAIDFDGRS